MKMTKQKKVSQQDKKNTRQTDIDSGQTDSISKEQEYLQGWKQALADYQNLQKQVEQEKKIFVKYANEQLIEDILPILENFEQATKFIPQTEKDNAWVTGIMYIKKQLEEVLAKQGISRIQTVGYAFDPTLHEAMEEKESMEKHGTVIEELRSGYKMHGKVLKPAQVIVAKEKNNKE